MLRSPELLRTYARMIQDLSRAEAVSLFLPPSAGGSVAGLLIHVAGSAAVPELAEAAAVAELPDVDGEAGRVLGSPDVRRVPSAAPGGTLIRISAEAAGVEPTDDRRRRAADRRAPLPANGPALWIGLRFAAGEGGGGVPLSDLRGEGAASWRPVLALGRSLAAHCRQVDAVLCDPVTGLTGRAAFQAAVEGAAAEARARQESLAVLLVNPDDFLRVNERFGSRAGDRVMMEIAGRLRESLRRSDPVYRYGGAVFAVVLVDADAAAAAVVAEKLHTDLTAGAYHRGALRLGFSCGLAAGDPASEERPEDAALALVRRADRSLARARLPESGPIVVASSGADAEVVPPRDRLSGIFTADLAKDYRNMLLLWDMVSLVTASGSFEELAAAAVERLDGTFRPDRIGLFAWRGDEPALLRGLVRRGDGPGALVLAEAERALLEQARLTGMVVEELLADQGIGYALPLVAHGEQPGCLYLVVDEAQKLDASDLLFLELLAGQLGGALDRIRLSEQGGLRLEEERRRLEAELEGLREATRKARLVYRSPQMAELLHRLQQVAPTDVTLLLTGPSGTGKELLAETIHQLSPRRSRPPIVVDCGAISATLIDSELFGHQRGAYTGAEKHTVGRLAEADGSTLILDEIGELPLEVQSKLLRFVQEKQITPVGGVRPLTVDVRLVAVTNRELEAEVRAGRFREDLFHRLNVFHVSVPSLAERPADIPVLVDYFLQRFARRYGKEIRGLTPEAAAWTAEYSWPGNVRELENRLLQAVILCAGDSVGTRELGPGAEAAAEETRVAGAETAGGGLPAAATPPALPADGAERTPGRESAEDAWESLRLELRRQIQSATASGAVPLPPLGRWLAEDLILAAHDAAGRVASRGAALLGIAETTYRRRLRQALAPVEAPRSPAWAALRPRIAELVRAVHVPGTDVVDRSRRLLLEEVVAARPGDPAACAALLGVSRPTLRRWLRELPARS